MDTAAPSGDPVAAVLESEATGETAEIFADLRQTLGVPVVNLIWRHLATIPGGLAWAWYSVRPLYVSGAIDAAVTAHYAGAALPSVPPLPRAMLRAGGIDGRDESEIRRILDSYHRSNAMNLYGLTALLLRLDGVKPATSQRPAGHSAPSLVVEGALPPLLTQAQMEPATAELVGMLNMLGERDNGRIVASMYRHLAHWPPFLSLFWALVAPLDADGRLGAAVEQGLRRSHARATGLIGGLATPPGYPPPESLGRIRAGLHDFITHPIGKMVTICDIVRRSMPPPEPARPLATNGSVR